MANRDVPPSRHYVDADGRPIAVRQLYRSCIVGLLAVSAFAAYASVDERSRPGFSLGVWAGTGITSFGLAAMYGWAWLNDLRHRAERRQYWTARDGKNVKTGAVAGGASTVLCLVALAVAAGTAHDELAGLFLALAFGSAFVAAATLDARKLRRERRGT